MPRVAVFMGIPAFAGMTEAVGDVYGNNGK